MLIFPLKFAGRWPFLARGALCLVVMLSQGVESADPGDSYLAIIIGWNIPVINKIDFAIADI